MTKIQQYFPNASYTACISFHIAKTLADPGGGGVAGDATHLNFQKRGVTSVAIVISTVSTVSEQERNGQRQIKPKRGNAISQNGDNERIYLHGLKKNVV